jgi:hypothetical protein
MRTSRTHMAVVCTKDLKSSNVGIRLGLVGGKFYFTLNRSSITDQPPTAVCLLLLYWRLDLLTSSIIFLKFYINFFIFLNHFNIPVLKINLTYIYYFNIFLNKKYLKNNNYWISNHPNKKIKVNVKDITSVN